MTAIFRSVLVFLGFKLAVLSVNVLTFPVLRIAPQSRPTGAGCASGARRSVSLLVPLRNEADRIADTLPGILAQSVDELILLDDCSTDSTSELVAALTAGHPNARVVTGSPTPPGWTGKTWACNQLAGLASSDLLMFCDADIYLAAGAVDAVVEQLNLQHADLLSVFPQQRTATLGEHLIVPLVDDVLLCFLPFFLLRADVPSAATANGSLLAIDRLAYQVAGGFEAVRAEVVEDVAFARLARRCGLQLGLVLGGDVVSTRMYTGYRNCVIGFGRGLLTMTGGSRWPLLVAAMWHLVVYTLPALVCWRRPKWAIPLIAALAERVITEAKTGRQRWWQALLTPISPLAALPVFGQATRPTQHWKGRTYVNGRLAADRARA